MHHPACPPPVSRDCGLHCAACSPYFLAYLLCAVAFRAAARAGPHACAFSCLPLAARLLRPLLCGSVQDYTLAQYKPETFELLAYTQTVDKLTRNFGYPEELKGRSFDHEYMMRGLTIDKARGNVLKVRLVCPHCPHRMPTRHPGAPGGTRTLPRAPTRCMHIASPASAHRRLLEQRFC